MGEEKCEIKIKIRIRIKITPQPISYTNVTYKENPLKNCKNLIRKYFETLQGEKIKD